MSYNIPLHFSNNIGPRMTFWCMCILNLGFGI